MFPFVCFSATPALARVHGRVGWFGFPHMARVTPPGMGMDAEPEEE